MTQGSFKSSLNANKEQESQNLHQVPMSKKTPLLPGPSNIHTSITVRDNHVIPVISDVKTETPRPSDDIMDRARAAIASAERASATARAAASLASAFKFDSALKSTESMRS